MTARLIQWAALWFALFGCADALAHVTTTGLLRIEVAEGRVLYALSVALPELPAASAAMLSAAANGNRTAAESVAEAARIRQYDQHQNFRLWCRAQRPSSRRWPRLK